MEIDGKVAIVTGAGAGIGAAVVRRLVDAGARVVAADLDGDRVRSLTADLGDRAVGVPGDVADTPVLEDLIGTATERFGPPDIFMANAGISGEPGIGDDTSWEQTFEVNVMAHVRAARLLVDDWCARGSGCFVATASAAGLLTQIGTAAYSTTKHATVAFAEWLAVTYGDRGVRVSCVCPMGVDTDMLRAGDARTDQGRLSAAAVRRSGAILHPDQVADAVLDGIRDERFLILPQPEVGDFVRQKASDHDRWLRGMQRLQRSLVADDSTDPGAAG